MIPFKSGYIAILGPPNVGKSTLLNSILGEKISIVSEKPQTTRQKFLGICHLKDAQLLFLDTPGLHTPHKRLNECMMEEAKSAIGDADLIYYMAEPKKPSEMDLSFLKEIENQKKTYFILINKVDRVAKLELLPLLSLWQEKSKAREYFLLCAKSGDGVSDLIQKSLPYLPEGPAYYSEEELTNRDMRYLASEIIREKLFSLTHEEIPYSIAVVIDEYIENAKPNLDKISATIYVEKESQKPIVIGKGGSLLKEVGKQARAEIEKLSQKKVFLTLFVKVVKDWTKSDFRLQELGYKF